METASRIEELQNRFAGKRIFLIGNGPSLKATPLDRLVNEYTFAMNRIALLYSTTVWRPRFFCCTTTNVAKPDWRRDIEKTFDLGIPSFVWKELLQYVELRDNIYPIECSHGTEVAESVPDEWWSDDVAERVCKFGTSMLPALQLAVYMGFSQIYLLGCDLGFQSTGSKSIMRHFLRYLPARLQPKPKNDPNHFDPQYGTPGFDADTLNTNMGAAHDLAKRACAKRGVKIYNATVGGELEVYPRVSLENVLDSDQIEMPQNA